MAHKTIVVFRPWTEGGVGWRELTFSKTARDGLAHLREAGLQALPAVGLGSTVTVH